MHTFFLKHTSTWFDARRVAIIGFGNVGLYIAALLLKDGYSVMVCDLNLDSRDIQQVMEAKLPEMLNSLLFGKHLQRYSTSDIRAILKRFSVATDLSELVRNGFKVVFECISEVLERKQHLFAGVRVVQVSIEACAFYVQDKPILKADDRQTLNTIVSSPTVDLQVVRP